MYTVFIVFKSGHAIELHACKFEQNAKEWALYHRTWSKQDDVQFKVLHQGKTIFTI